MSECVILSLWNGFVVVVAAAAASAFACLSIHSYIYYFFIYQIYLLFFLLISCRYFIHYFINSCMTHDESAI